MLNNISDITRLMCGIILITVPTIEFGGVFLLKMLRTREPGYLDNPIRQNLFRAGHAMPPGADERPPPSFSETI